VRSQPYLLGHLLEPDTGQADRTALVDGERTMTYGGFAAAAQRCSASLLRAGLERGDRVVIFLARGIEECWAIFGASLASGVFVPVNVLLRGPQLRQSSRTRAPASSSQARLKARRSPRLCAV